MQKKNRIEKGTKNRQKLWFAGILLAVCFLCGCTKKEELLLLTETAVAQEAAIEEAAPQEDKEAGNAQPGGVLSQTGEETSGFQETGASAEASVDRKTEKSMVCVHVCGAVNAPGVYELPEGSRVYEAVQAADGFSADAEQNYVNQAQILTDGSKLVIPTEEEAAQARDSLKVQDSGQQNYDASEHSGGTASQIGITGGVGAAEEESAKRSDGRVNINIATKQELCTIPGVGETRAEAIISYRESGGGFRKPEDIMKVNGIKEGMYNKIKDSICVE